MADTTNNTEQNKLNRILVYFLAAPEDEDACKAVHQYLSPVLRNSKIPIDILTDYSIPAGNDINKHKEKLYDADIVLAFGSKDFIANEETYQRTQKVILRYNNNETVLLAILVHNFFWKLPPFGILPILPKNRQPIKNAKFWSEEDAFTSVVEEIYIAINDLISEESIEQAKADTKTGGG